MTETKNKTDEKDVKADKKSKSLKEMLLNCSKEKYRLVSLATRWAYEIKTRDQETLPVQELVNKALKEILTGQVAPETIEKLPPVQKEKKFMDTVSKAAREKGISLKDGDKKDKISI